MADAEDARGRETRYDDLATRITALEAQIAELRAESVTARPRVDPGRSSESPIATTERMLSSSVEKPWLIKPPKRARSSVETLVAGRGLQVAGLVLVLIGAAFFLELAFTRNWVGPLERIIIGLIAGSAAIVLSARKLQSAYRKIAESLTGLGAGILYLSLWASVAVFPELHVPRLAVFVAMFATTLVLGALAERRHSLPIALMGLLGGFLTPLLLANGSPDRVALAAYLVVLTAGMLLIAVRSNYVAVAVATLVSDLLYATQFAPVADWSTTQAMVVAAAIASLLFSAFTYAIITGKNNRAYLACLCTTVALFVIVAESLYTLEQTILGGILVALAAVLVGIVQVQNIPVLLKRTCGYLAISAITLAVPALIHDTTIVHAFIVESAILAFVGLRRNDGIIIGSGGGLFAIMGLVLLGQATTEPFDQSITLGIGFTLWLVGAVLAWPYLAKLDFPTIDLTKVLPLAEVAIHLVALIGLTRALIDAFGGHPYLAGSGTQFAISVLWTSCATVLFAIGLRSRKANLRWEGLTLFGMTIIKVFAVDLSSLAVEYRIGSFLVLGVVLFVVSAWYMRSTAKRPIEGESQSPLI